ncbi:helix-turn-helix domain-containing protein [Actinomadura geliboluensis]|uniref:helix-turn-helix domain-containing protein n=1 Tax=Actinomadura geliboluensis TaxID=882440 RepID=UPI00372148D8
MTMSDRELDQDELAVIAHAAAGLTWQEVGAALGVSERTVRRRFANAAATLGTRGAVQTVAVAVARKLVDPEDSPEKAVITPRHTTPTAGAKPGRKPGQTIAAAIPKICATLPTVGGALPLACAAAGVSYNTVLERQKNDPDLRRRLLSAGWAPGRHGPTPRVAAALDTVLAELSRGATLGKAAQTAGISSPTVYTHVRRDAAFRAQFEQARDEGRQASRRTRDRDASRQSRGDPRRQKNGGKQTPREHNIRTRDQRRRKTLARFTPDAERALLAALRSGGPIAQAAEQVGMTPQTLFGRARFDRAWSVRLDRALMVGRDPGISHGTDHAYKRHRCRCPECREAHARFT